MNPLLKINDLAISFNTIEGKIQAVSQVSLDVLPGETVGIVGESGCGKSVTAHAIMKLIPCPPGKYEQGQIFFEGSDLLQQSEEVLQKIRGKKIGMIFQDPMTSLNPVLTIGDQITEVLELHEAMSPAAAKSRAAQLLQLVGIPSAQARLNNYPHEFSGGMRQRVLIAMALACNPKLLIADEPTTALDVTIQAQILELLKEIQQKFNTAIILISHDLGVVAGLCQKVVVMYAGRVVEAGPVTEIFRNPKHPYTWGLLKSVPRLDSVKHEALAAIEGQPPDLRNLPSGCAFHLRCPHAMKICAEETPPCSEVSSSHQVTCWLEHPAAPKLHWEGLLK